VVQVSCFGFLEDDISEVLSFLDDGVKVGFDFKLKWNALMNVALEYQCDRPTDCIILKELEVVVNLIQVPTLHDVVDDDVGLSIPENGLLNELVQVCSCLVLYLFLVQNIDFILKVK
jgi:hypothetical protein